MEVKDEPDPDFLQMLVCPETKQPLRYDREAQELISEAAGLAYPVREGIPILLAKEARKLGGDAPGSVKPPGL